MKQTFMRFMQSALLADGLTFSPIGERPLEFGSCSSGLEESIAGSTL